MKIRPFLICLLIALCSLFTAFGAVDTNTSNLQSAKQPFFSRGADQKAVSVSVTAGNTPITQRAIKAITDRTNTENAPAAYADRNALLNRNSFDQLMRPPARKYKTSFAELIKHKSKHWRIGTNETGKRPV